MDVRKLLANPLFRWDRREPAEEAAIERLKTEGPDNLPVTYLRYLTLCDGGGGPIPQDPGHLELIPAEDVLDLNRRSGVADGLPGYFAFGTGEGTLFLFDLRASDGARVCAAPSGALDAARLDELAASFSDFLGRALRMRGGL